MSRIWSQLENIATANGAHFGLREGFLAVVMSEAIEIFGAVSGLSGCPNFVSENYPNHQIFTGLRSANRQQQLKT